MDGIYHGENKQLPSSSSGNTRAQTLFEEYQKSVFIVDNSSAPGFAFKNSLPYIEFKELELQTLASTKTQLQFYQEARIKTAIFMGCKTGEIELGMSIDTQADFEMKMRNCFPEDFSQLQSIPIQQLPQPTDQNPPSSSSSSLRSLSIDSPSSAMPNFLFNNNNISTNPYPLEPSVKPVQTLSQIRNNIQFPTLLQSTEEDDAMTRAILAVISSSSSSPSSSTNSSQKPQQNSSAFKSYRSVLAPTSRVAQKQNMLIRAIAFVTSTSNTLMRNQEQTQNGNRPASNQLHHMISERRRREKLNESFQALRSLLPPGSKKDKASVLNSTKEYVNSLKAEVEELSRKNQILEAQLLQNDDQELGQMITGTASSTTDQRVVDVRITNIIVAETTSSEAARILDLRVIVRSGGEYYCSMLDLAIRVLEFLKQLRNVITLISVEADTPMLLETTSVNRLVLRLKIEGDEWDDTTFQEAVRRVVADLAQ